MILTSAATTDDDIRLLRDALRGTLGMAKDDQLATVDLDWRSGWAALTALGVTAFCVPEDEGGLGLQVHAAVATAMELGAALHASPYASLVASGHALGCAANRQEPAVADLLSGMLTGDLVCAFGRLDPDGRRARTIDTATQADALLLVDASSRGCLLFTDRSEWQADGSRHRFDVTRTCADLTLDLGRAHRLPDRGQAVELHRLLLAADAVGCVQRMLDHTVDYAGQRLAFGRPIGGFQAVQHRLVDHAVRARGMALVAIEAARLMADASPEAERFVAMAEVSVSSSATRIIHDLLQLTGAIGFTWEHGLHLYERRVHQDARLGANPRAATRSLAQIEGWTRAR